MILAKPAFAVCPVCTVAVGSGLAIAELLGIDDLLVSIWIGALVASSAFWMADKFRWIKLPRPKTSWVAIFYLFTLGTLMIQGKLNDPLCQIWGINKIFLGITAGNLFFGLGVGADLWLRTKNKNRVFFPYQKVVLPLLAVLLATLFFYLTTCITK